MNFVKNIEKLINLKDYTYVPGKTISLNYENKKSKSIPIEQLWKHYSSFFENRLFRKIEDCLPPVELTDEERKRTISLILEKTDSSIRKQILKREKQYRKGKSANTKIKYKLVVNSLLNINFCAKTGWLEKIAYKAGIPDMDRFAEYVAENYREEAVAACERDMKAKARSEWIRKNLQNWQEEFNITGKITVEK